MLDGSNYAYWKLRLRTYLKSVDGQCWEACLKHYVMPLKDANEQGDKVPVKYADYTPTQKAEYNSNEKALNVLFTWVDNHMFHLISNCTSAQQAWDIL